MGERLLAFVREVLRQRELLEGAMERDDVAISLMREEEIGRRNRRHGTGHRRIWTRRDKHLLDASDDGNMGCPRTERILERLRPDRGEGPHVPLLREALNEARSEGTFSHLAPILEALADAHANFFNHAEEIAAGQSGANMRFPYGRVKGTHDEAVNRVMPFLPPDAVQFDKQYAWDGRHESPILCRDLVRPSGKSDQAAPPASAQFTMKKDDRVMARESPFPYEYGSDLHWLWGWGERLRSLLSDDVPPSKYDWMVFRPDRLARDAMMRFSIKYSHVIKQIDDYLDFTEARFDDFLSDDNDSTRANFAGAMDSLCERIEVGTETIAESESASRQPEPADGLRSSSRSDRPTNSDGANECCPSLEHRNPKQTVRSHIFVSYSHKDERWLNDLKTHLAPFCRDGSITAWSDQQIATGSKWFSDIQAALAQSSVAVLLVTPDFLASDFIHEYELTPILKEAELGGMRIVWIPVATCSYAKTRLKDRQAVIDPVKPLAAMPKAKRDAAWVTICQEIEKATKC